METVSLSERMKNYETVSRVSLDTRSPIILRVDGKAFHTYLKSVPAHTDIVNTVMDDVTIELCKNIQGAQFAYVQSDEISVFIHSYKKHNSSAWFDGNIQKMVSVAASITSVSFTLNSWKIFNGIEDDYVLDLSSVHDLCKPAYFDARVFNLPENEVNNYFIWRQNGAIRNSVSSQARLFFSHKQLENRDHREMKELLYYKGKAWEDLPIGKQRGRCIMRLDEEKSEGVVRPTWKVDLSIPLFAENRDYVNKFLAKEETGKGHG